MSRVCFICIASYDASLFCSSLMFQRVGVGAIFNSNFTCVRLQRGKMQHRSDFGDQTFPNLNFAASCVWQAWALEPLPAHGGYVSRLFGKCYVCEDRGGG